MSRKSRRENAIDQATVALIKAGADDRNPESVYRAARKVFVDRARPEVYRDYQVSIEEAINSRPALNSARSMATEMVDLLMAIEKGRFVSGGKRKSFVVGGEEVHIDNHSHNVKGKGKSMAGRKRKRTVSRKTLDALRRGREKLARMRAGKRTRKHGASRKVRAARPLSQEGAAMASRKKRTRRTSRRARRFAGTAGMSGGGGMEGGRRRRRSRARRYFGGMTGGRRRRRARRYGGYLMGGSGGGVMATIKRNMMPVALGIAGAAGAGFALSRLPATMNPMLRASIPLAGGLGLAAFVKNPMAQAIGLGAAIIGGYTLARQALPNIVPSLAGVDETVDAALVGLGDVQQLGMNDDVLGEVESLADDMEGADDLEGDEDALGADQVEAL